jgi:hypothetical protein
MRQEIVDFLKEVLPPLGLSADYMTGKDTYLIHKQGRMIQGFTTKIFYSIPKRARKNELGPLLTFGLTSNLGNSNNQNLFIERRVGKRIV